MDHYLEKENTTKLILKFSIPCVLSLLISALYNIVDQIFIGHSSVGAIGNTATSLAFPLITLTLAFALMLGDGSAAFMSLCMGKKDYKSLSKVVGNSIVVSLVISVVFLAVCYPLLNQILVFLGAQNQESLNCARDYTLIVMIGFPFFIVMNMLNSVIRADGSPKFAMIAMTTGAVINIVLDAIFIMGLDMGVQGAALATIIGQIVGCIISVIYIIHPKNFKLSLKDFKMDFAELSKVLRLGFSSFLTQFSIVIITIVIMNMLAKYGSVSKYGANDPQAIVGVAMKVFTIVINISVGIAAGAQPIVGYNYGARRFDRVRKLYRHILVSNIVLGITCTVLFQLIPDQIIGMFGSNSKNPDLYREFGEQTVRIYLMLTIFTIIQKSSAIFLQSIGKPVKSVALSLMRDIICLVPLTVLLPMHFGIIGILYSAPIADCIGLVLTAILVVVEFKKMKQLELAK